MKRVRLLSLLLCLVLLAGLIPVTARAEDGGTLYVNGVAVTQENAGDILGNGVFSYVEREERIGPDSVICKYLLVRGSFAGTTDGPLIENRIEGLNVWADEPSELTAAGTVIRSYADVTVTGFAGLTLRSEEGNCIEIRNGKKLMLDRLCLKAEAKNFVLAGADTAEELLIVASDLELTGGQGVAQAFSGGLTLHATCKITSPKNAVVRNNGIVYFSFSDLAYIAPNSVTVSATIDRDDNGVIDVEDFLAFIVYYSQTIHQLEMLFYVEKYDLDLNGLCGRNDFQAFIDRLFPYDSLRWIVAGAYDHETGEFLGAFMFSKAYLRELDEYYFFFDRREEYRLIFIGEGNVPLCRETTIDRSGN